MYHKCKPDSSRLNIIADTMLYEIHLVLYYIYIFQISIVSFDILILYFSFFFVSYLIFFTQAVKTILHFNPEREHLDFEEVTVFFFCFLLSQLKIKLLLLKQTQRVCSVMTMSLSQLVYCIQVTKNTFALKHKQV